MDLFTTTLTEGNDTATIAGIDVDIPWTVNALGGDDFVTVTGGWMTRCYMGDGDDVVRVDGGTYVQVYGANGADRVDMYAGNVLFNGDADNDIANIFGGMHLQGYGGTGSDQFSFFADVGADLSGGGGNDLFRGNGHSITGTVNGDDGNDRFSNFHTPNPSDLTLEGGLGNDSYYIDNTDVQISEDLSSGTDTVYSSISYVLNANFENLRLLGSSSIDATGNSRNNLLIGNSGANLLEGGGGADMIQGRGGNDTLWGGFGADQLWGGTGADEFAFASGQFGGFTAATAERIHDFIQAEGDQINLEQIDANPNIDGDQAFVFIGSQPFHHVANELRFVQSASFTYIFADTKGDGTADILIVLDGQHALTIGDFIL